MACPICKHDPPLAECRLCWLYHNDARYKKLWDTQADSKSGTITRLIDKPLRLASARRKWVAAGKPQRSPEQIAEIFDTICTPCEHFRPTGDGKGTCDKCGCRLKRQGGLLNKILMATESCPIDKWPSAALDTL
jgi:hypothetical protein